MNEEKNVEKTAKKEKKTRDKKKHIVKDRSFNILDVLIIIGILSFVSVVVLVYSPLGVLNFATDSTTIIYSVCIPGVSAEYAGNVRVGDIVTDSEGYNMGIVVSDVEIEPHVIYEYRETNDGGGSIVKITHPELVDLIITISADAEISDDGYMVDGKRIALEAEYELVFPGLESKCVCVSLSEEKGKEAGAAK